MTGKRGRAGGGGAGSGRRSGATTSRPRDGDATAVGFQASGSSPEGSGLAGEDERLARAARLAEEGQGDEAMEGYRELLLVNPAHVGARVGLGLMYERMGEPLLALEQFEAARAASPEDPEVIGHLATALAALGRFEQSERELKRAVRLHPERADLHEALGIQFFKRGLYAQSEAELRRAVELDTELAAAYHHRGEALNQLGRVNEALEVLKRAVQLDPHNAKAYYTMGILYDKKHLRREAEAMYRKAREVGSA